MFKKLAVTAAVLAALAGPALVLAQPHEGGGPEAMFERLDLSDAQWLQIHKLMQQHRAAAQPLRQRERQLHQALAALDAASPDYALQLQRLQDDAAQLARDRVQDLAALKNQAAALLTPQQRATLAEQVKDFGRRGPPPAD